MLHSVISREKKTLEIDRRGRGGLSQLVSGVTTEKDIQLEINKIQENINKGNQKLLKIIRNPKIKSQIADALGAYNTKEGVDSLVQDAFW